MTDKGYNEKEIVIGLKDESRRAAAFSAIVNRYSQQIYWHIRRMVFSHDDANDLVQNTFIKAWTNIDKFRGDSQVSTWLYRIAVNETLNFLSKGSPDTVSLDTPEGAMAEMLESDTYFNGDHVDALFQEAISQLPHKQRLIFNMKYFDDMKYEEISEILGTSTGALKASYHIAIKKIENYLNNND